MFRKLCLAASPPSRQLHQIRRSVPQPTFQSLVNSRLDYGNGALNGLPVYLARRLQSVLNAVARLIFDLRRSDHVSDALISLHWLRVPERIRSKVAVLIYKVLHGCSPSYVPWPVHLRYRRSKSPRTSFCLQRLLCSASGSLFHCWQPNIFGCWPSGVVERQHRLRRPSALDSILFCLLTIS